jgi:hypothetical protein
MWRRSVTTESPPERREWRALTAFRHRSWTGRRAAPQLEPRNLQSEA